MTKTGFKIKYYRKVAGLTQDELASFIGLSRVSLVNIESGRQKPPIYIVQRICAILNKSPSELLSVPTFKIRYNSNKKIEIKWSTEI